MPSSSSKTRGRPGAVHLSLPLVNYRGYPRGAHLAPDFTPACGGSPDWRARYLADRAKEQSPRAIPAAMTSKMRERVARLAARLGPGPAADSVDMAME